MSQFSNSRGSQKPFKTATRAPIRDLVPLTEPSTSKHTINITHNGSSKQVEDDIDDNDDDYYNEALNNRHDDARPLEDESKFYSSPKNNVEKDHRDDIDELETSHETNGKGIEAHTVILTDNFFLPGSQNEEKQKEVEDEPEYEYEYEYIEETEEPPAEQPKKKEEIKVESTTASTTTTTTEKPVEIKVSSTEPTPPRNQGEGDEDEDNGNTTESWVVVASVQTSRSVSGARFLPFPQVKQDEKKAPITELDAVHKSSEEKAEPDSPTPETETVQETTILETTTIKSVSPTTTTSSVSMESINDKLDSIQSELSSGLLSGEFPVLKEMTTEEITKAPTVFIRKFSPKSKTISTTEKSTTLSSTTTESTTPASTVASAPKKITIQEDLTGLLPANFKPLYTGYKNKKISTTTTTTTTTVEPEIIEKPARNVNNTRSFFKNDASAQDVQEVNSKIKFLNDDIAKFLPKDYTTESPKLSKLKVVDDVSKFLPPGYKAASTEKPPGVIPLDDISKFLPKDYKPEPVDIKKFLPKDYKPEPEAVDIKKFLPPGYKPPIEEKEETNEQIKLDEILKKIQFKEVSSLLPKDFKPQVVEEASTETTTTTTVKSNGPVFPTRPGGNKEAGLPAYKRPKGPPPPKIEIKKGTPTR